MVVEAAFAGRAAETAPDRAHLFQQTCRFVTECLLWPVRAAVAGDNCSKLLAPETFAFEQTLDGTDTVRVAVRGVRLNSDFVYSEEVHACASAHFQPKYVVERIALDTHEDVEYALEAVVALLCVVLLALVVHRFRRFEVARVGSRKGATPTASSV